MSEMYTKICSWENLRLAYHKAARGKRGRRAAAAFEYNLADRLLELEHELRTKTYHFTARQGSSDPSFTTGSA